MLENITRAQLVWSWVVAVIVLCAVSVVAGFRISLETGVLWLVACVVPPAITVRLWHGERPVTVAELLHTPDTKER